MKHKYEIDEKILKKITHCQKDFSCLEGYFPKTCVYVPGIENVICENMETEFCCYRWEYIKDKRMCICPVRREIYNKYKK
jgi:hypothetical protein